MIDELKMQLKDLIAHLRRYEEKKYLVNFLEILRLLEAKDRRGLDALKSMMRGGMGSFNDLVICQINGHKIEKNEEDFANEELERLKNLIFKTIYS